MDKINEIKSMVEATYATLNQFASEGVIPLIDIAYPNHDGKQDADAVADMMLLRDNLNSLSNVCQLVIEHINGAIE